MTRAFIVKVSNADAPLQAYTARQCLRHAHERSADGSPQLLTTCVWVLGEYGHLLSGDGLLDGSDAA